jgi:hypothetical protein
MNRLDRRVSENRVAGKQRILILKGKGALFR